MVEALMTTGTFPPLAMKNHQLRLSRVKDILVNERASSVLDIGCGEGELIDKLQAVPSIKRITGVDSSENRLRLAKEKILKAPNFGKVTLSQACMLDLDETYSGHDAAVLVETIEHVPISEVAKIEAGIFGKVEPRLVVVTTPDATARLTDEKMQQRGHHFEWDVAEFSEWASSIEEVYPYTPAIELLDGPSFVRPTQIAVFHRD